MTQKVWTKEEIREQLEASDKWLARGVVAIYKFQTETEKNTEATLEDNGVGFNGADANILSSFAKFIIKTGFLTPKQRYIARKRMLKYAGQLAKIANGKI